MPWFDRMLYILVIGVFGCAVATGFWWAYMLYKTSPVAGILVLIITLFSAFWYIGWSYRTLHRVW